MTIARVTKITAASPKGFHEEIHSGIERASKTLRGITGFQVLEEKARANMQIPRDFGNHLRSGRVM